MQSVQDIIKDIRRKLVVPQVGLINHGVASGPTPAVIDRSFRGKVTEARGKTWTHWWVLPDSQVVKVPEGTHFHYVASLTPEEAMRQFKLPENTWSKLHDADVNNTSMPQDAIKQILDAGAIRLSLYGDDLGIETSHLDDETLHRIQSKMPAEAKAKTVTWDSPFSDDPPISTSFAELMSGSINDLKPRAGSSLAMFREANEQIASIKALFESNADFDRILLREVMVDVRKHVSKDIIAKAWGYRGNGYSEFHAKLPNGEEFYWHGKEGTVAHAKSEGWTAYLNKIGAPGYGHKEEGS